MPIYQHIYKYNNVFCLQVCLQKFIKRGSKNKEKYKGKKVEFIGSKIHYPHSILLNLDSINFP